MSVIKMFGVLLALTLFAQGQSASVILDGQLASGVLSGIPTGPVGGMTVWYSADCVTFASSVCGTPSNGTSVTAWADRSGHANNLGIITGTCNFNTSQINSKPAVAFNSSCAFDFGSHPAGSTQWTMFVVYKRGSATSGKGDFISGFGSDSFKYGTDSAVAMQEISGSALSAKGNAAADINFHQMNVLWEDSTHGNLSQFRIDRTSDGSPTQTVNVNSSSSLQTVGADRSNGTAFLDGKIAELIIYTTALTPTQITQNEAYLHGKYGL